MKDKNISSTSCLIIDIISNNRLLMCKFERKKWYKIGLCSTLKKTEKNKIRRCILTLSHLIYTLH